MTQDKKTETTPKLKDTITKHASEKLEVIQDKLSEHFYETDITLDNHIKSTLNKVEKNILKLLIELDNLLPSYEVVDDQLQAVIDSVNATVDGHLECLDQIPGLTEKIAAIRGKLESLQNYSNSDIDFLMRIQLHCFRLLTETAYFHSLALGFKKKEDATYANDQMRKWQSQIHMLQAAIYERTIRHNALVKSEADEILENALGDWYWALEGSKYHMLEVNGDY